MISVQHFVLRICDAVMTFAHTVNGMDLFDSRRKFVAANINATLPSMDGIHCVLDIVGLDEVADTFTSVIEKNHTAYYEW